MTDLPTLDPARPVRLLVVDFTAAGDGTATGELKSSILFGLDDMPIMQVSAAADRLAYGFPNDAPELRHAACFEDLLAQLDWFAPTIILARPTAEHEHLWLLALALRARFDAPLLVWIMDDWLSVMEDAAQSTVFEESLTKVLRSTGSGLSICDEMSAAFGDRFGVSFTAIANGIDPTGEFSRFSARMSDPDEPFVFRYAGALAHNMGVDTLETVAHAVHRLRRAGLNVCFELKTRGFWLEKEGARFRGLEGVQATESNLARAPYLSWLSEADCNLICYNFSDDTQRYVRYSLANKLPELLGVGAPVLGIGPANLPTLARIRDLGAGFHLSNPRPDAIERCLQDIVEQRSRLKDVAERGRHIAEVRFNLEDVRTRFRQALLKALGDHSPAGEHAIPQLVSAAAGFDRSVLPIDLETIAQAVPPLRAPGRIDSPPSLRATHRSGDQIADEQGPPRPTTGEASRFGVGDGAPLTRPEDRPATVPVSLPVPPRSTAGLPLRIDRSGNRPRPWLAPLVSAATAFSTSARERARSAGLIGAAASTSTPGDTAAYQSAPDTQISALGGGGIEAHEGGGLTVRRQGAAPVDHAEIRPMLTNTVSAIRLDITDVRGKAEITANGEMLASIMRPGIVEVSFRQPRPLDRILVRCLNSMEAKVDIGSITYLESVQL
ncbi:MAG: hypothetical protein AAF253_05465 [Pseudomonadota bacterium]